MRFTTLFLVLPLCVTPALAQPDLGAPLVGAQNRAAPQTPAQQVEAEVRGFVGSLNGNNVYFNALNSVANVQDIGYFGGPEWATRWEAKRGNLRLEIEKIDIVEIKETTATIRVNYFWQSYGLHVRTATITENLNLKKGTPPDGGKTRWQIVPPRTAEEVKTLGLSTPAQEGDVTPMNAPVLNECAAKIADPNAVWPFLRPDSSDESLANLKQLGLATLMLAQDYDDKYAFAAPFYKEALEPYSLKQDIWTIPATGEAYTFNGNLSGRSWRAIPAEKSSQFVVFYEGQNEKPVFRYDGRAAILFADGHTRLVALADADKLIWNP